MHEIDCPRGCYNLTTLAPFQGDLIVSKVVFFVLFNTFKSIETLIFSQLFCTYFALFEQLRDAKLKQKDDKKLR